MKMNCTHKIIVSEHYNRNSLVTREVAIALMSIVKSYPYYDVEIDFSNIDFISRSFADQFHKEKIQLWESNDKNVVVINAHDDVLSMFQAVSKTQNAYGRSYSSYPLLNFQTRRSLKNYLESV